MPEGDTLYRTAAGLRPYLVGRDVIAARARGPGAVPQIHRVVGRRVDAVEAHGKNLLIRFDGGLELRTHLRMNGSWHRYRPGERWRRPPGRARLVLEVDGAVAVCFDAPVVELFEARTEPLHPSLSRLGPDLLSPDFDAAEALRRLRSPERQVDVDQRRPPGSAGTGRHRQHLAQRDAVRRAGRPVRVCGRPRRCDARAPGRDGPSAADATAPVPRPAASRCGCIGAPADPAHDAAR